MLHESEEITYWNENWVWGEGRPWYDREYFYEVKEKARVLFLRYALKSYYYIESLIDIYSETDRLGEEYAWKDVPEKNIKLTEQVIKSLGITASRGKCYFLSRQRLQNLYDEISENNAFRDERWSAPEDKSAYKTRSDTAKKDVWTKEDECWCLELQQEINGLTVDGSAVIVLLNENEVMYLSLTGILPGEYIEQETQGLMEYTVIMSKLQEITNGLFMDGTAAGEAAEISDLKLEYVCTDISVGVYRPVWKVTITYDIKAENGSLDEADTDILIDAITGNEILNGFAGKETSAE
ncbi:MAG: hypothetical protein SOW08_08440 [Lachnospiraceae bacterium]|nr:hypothetical protein [Lachnospiraceae bacterium]